MTNLQKSAVTWFMPVFSDELSAAKTKLVDIGIVENTHYTIGSIWDGVTHLDLTITSPEKFAEIINLLHGAEGNGRPNNDFYISEYRFNK